MKESFLDGEKYPYLIIPKEVDFALFYRPPKPEDLNEVSFFGAGTRVNDKEWSFKWEGIRYYYLGTRKDTSALWNHLGQTKKYWLRATERDEWIFSQMMEFWEWREKHKLTREFAFDHLEIWEFRNREKRYRDSPEMQEFLRMGFRG